jgi:hypothetical protein
VVLVARIEPIGSLGGREENKNHPAQKRLRGSYYNKNNLRSLYSSRSTCIRRMEKRLNSSLSRSRSLRPNEKDFGFFPEEMPKRGITLAGRSIYLALWMRSIDSSSTDASTGVWYTTLLCL